MQKYLFGGFWGLLFLLLAGCHPEMDFINSSVVYGQAEMSLSDDKLSIVFTSDAGLTSVDLEANRKWTAAFVNGRADDWCSLSLYNGERGVATINITVKENPDYDERSASIIFECEDVRRTIVVTQKQKDALILSSSRIDMGKDGGRFNVEVKANVPFEYTVSAEAKAWLRNVGTKGLTTSMLTFQVDPLDDVGIREGTIVVNGAGKSETVHIYQEGPSPELVLSSDMLQFSASPASFRVEVRSNVDVSVEIPESCNWIQENKTKSMSTNTYNFSIERNDSRHAREGYIEFKNDEQKCNQRVSVIQDYQAILDNQDTLFASGRGNTLYLYTAGGKPDDYRIKPNQSWIKTESWDGKRFPLLIQEQPANSEVDREGLVLVYYQNYMEPDTLLVHQYRRLPSFSFSTAASTVSAPDIGADNPDAIVFWGEGNPERWRPGLTHTYKSSAPHTVIVETSDKTMIAIGMDNGMTINIRDLRKE